VDKPFDVSGMKQESPATPLDPTDVADSCVEKTSQEYVASWNHLVSTTNWEKGRIISEWRESLRAVDAAPSSYADEAWSRRVGNVTPQHVGRLRRVWRRFHKTSEQYRGLYWSHFQAVLDWDDAEMWLEGAVQSGWSVAVMRQNRWEALGAPADQKPRDEDVILSELDEDVSAADDAPSRVADGEPVAVQGFDEKDGDDASDDAPFDTSDAIDAPNSESYDADASPVEPVRPFEDLATLPADLHEAFEAMKLAVLNHKLAGWRDVRREDVVAALRALEQLALAPSED